MAWVTALGTAAALHRTTTAATGAGTTRPRRRPSSGWSKWVVPEVLRRQDTTILVLPPVETWMWTTWTLTYRTPRPTRATDQAQYLNTTTRTRTTWALPKERPTAAWSPVEWCPPLPAPVSVPCSRPKLAYPDYNTVPWPTTLPAWPQTSSHLTQPSRNGSSTPNKQQRSQPRPALLRTAKSKTSPWKGWAAHRMHPTRTMPIFKFLHFVSWASGRQIYRLFDSNGKNRFLARLPFH